MIRVNLLGQARPKPPKRVVAPSTAATVILFTAAIALAASWLAWSYARLGGQLQEQSEKMRVAQSEKERLQPAEAEQQQLQAKAAEFERHIAVVQQLEDNRTGGAALLSAMAGAVVRTDALWLTTLTRKGQSLEFEGEAGSINAVARFIAALRGSGYFDQVEIKEAKEDDADSGEVATFNFTMSAAARAQPHVPAAPGAAPGAAAVLPARPAVAGRS